MLELLSQLLYNVRTYARWSLPIICVVNISAYNSTNCILELSESSPSRLLGKVICQQPFRRLVKIPTVNGGALLAKRKFICCSSDSRLIFLFFSTQYSSVFVDSLHYFFPRIFPTYCIAYTVVYVVPKRVA